MRAKIENQNTRKAATFLISFVSRLVIHEAKGIVYSSTYCSLNAFCVHCLLPHKEAHCLLPLKMCFLGRVALYTKLYVYTPTCLFIDTRVVTPSAHESVQAAPAHQKQTRDKNNT